MIDLKEFVEVPLNERVRKLELGQIILIDQVDSFRLQTPLRREEIKPRDPKLSRTLYPPFGSPMFVKDVELDKWLRREVQKQSTRTITKTPQTTTAGTNGSNNSR